MPKSSAHTAMLWTVAGGFFMQALDTTIINTALPSMAGSLGVSALEMHPVVVAYTLTMALLTPASGWLSDRFGSRRVYFVSILLFVLGSIFCALSQSLPQLVAARVVQGVGGAMLLPVGRLAVLRAIRGEAYVAALAMISIAGQVGPIVGPTLGGWFVQSMTWHTIFLINVPGGAIGLVAVWKYLPDDSLPDAPRFDWLGGVLLSLCMVSFSLALEGPASSNRLLTAGLLLALSLLSVAAYIWHARRHPDPLFRLSLFQAPNFSVGLAGNLVCRIGSSAVPFLLPLLMQLQLGYSPLHSGLMLLPAAVSGAIAKSWIAPLLKRYGYTSFLIWNTVIVGASIAAFATFSPVTPLWVEIAVLCLFGASNSMQFAAMNGVTLKGLPPRDAGSGNSLFSMVQMLAIGLGVTIGGGLVSLFAAGGDAANAFRIAFAVTGAVTLASALVFRRIDTPARLTPQAA
ncbi:drug resistance MFS transporter, drug:H+ antiporter-2 family [Bordetella hinzii 1277]|uniref:DHA2 family efflux MFS transporter permease subunit n=1 Tax=Bordetella hinzii TaxID=103855 RepID=UPI00045A9068|nr:DHA2 family efflux MFS transporter permease subunit [Bordetella hinzii]KCB52446.1 drug resistance MFS transporter, drug:H+ antiporter-2 family [Bordetella hinzii 1277]